MNNAILDTEARPVDVVQVKEIPDFLWGHQIPILV
jgi:hypothetical protein